MDRFEYTPDPDLKVHGAGAIKLICAAFQSHEDGLPEWVKNSADEYARTNVPAADRVIIVFLSDAKHRRLPTISCLDFGGMTSATILEHFRHWGSPEASQQSRGGSGVQGGHGNGGKCYMTQMFEDRSYIYTVLGDRGNLYGVPGGSVEFGFIPDREHGRDFEAPDVTGELDKALEGIGCRTATIEKILEDRLSDLRGFTFTVGVWPRGYRRKIRAKALVESLRNHPQMVRTLETCKVYVVANGEIALGGNLLAPPPIEPIAGAETPLEIGIPARVKDPQTGQRISTTKDGSYVTGTLALLTSKKRMRWSMKGRHNVRFEANGEIIGFVPVPDLDVRSAYKDQIYGTCRLDALAEFKQNQRAALAESPLTRGVRNFIASQVEEYCRQFEQRDRRSHDQKARSEISRINEVLDHWKNQFLNEVVGQQWGVGGIGEPPKPPPLPSGKPVRIEMQVRKRRLGRGVAIRPRLRFFDADDRRVRAVPIRWVSDDNNVAMVDEGLQIITAFSTGTAAIHAETEDGGLCSNDVPVEVVEIEQLAVEPEAVSLTVGSRSSLIARCRLRDGTEATDVQLIWTEGNPDVARVSASGMVFGVGQGQTEVTVGDDYALADNAATVTVGAGESGGPGRDRGRGFPRILVSGEIDPDPDTGEYVHLSSDHPPVYQRPQDVERNIWWINSGAPLAKLFLNAREGYGYETREWRMYHLERLMDIIVQIAVEYLAEGDLPAAEWTQRWGDEVARIQAAVASDLRGFIETGDTPGIE